jgi:hypothetical protein
MHPSGPSGITHRFQWLSQSEGYVGYVLLTLSPLYSPEGFRARLACLIHTASVHSEPGSNPSNLSLFGYLEICVCTALTMQTLRSPLSFQEPPLFSKIVASASRHQPGHRWPPLPGFRSARLALSGREKISAARRRSTAWPGFPLRIASPARKWLLIMDLGASRGCRDWASTRPGTALGNSLSRVSPARYAERGASLFGTPPSRPSCAPQAQG